MSEAQKKIDRYKSLQPNTENEIEYLESEVSALNSFIEYHNLQEERENELCTVFKDEREYGTSLQTPESMIDAASKRLIELKGRLFIYTERSNGLKKKIEFLEHDIDLLKNMLKSSPRETISEYGLPELI